MTITAPRLRELIRFAEDRAGDTTLPYADLQCFREVAEVLTTFRDFRFPPPGVWSIDPADSDGCNLVSAKQLQWVEEHSPVRGFLEAHDSVWGFSVHFDEDEPEETRYSASWGEGDTEHFASLDAAKAWCQEQADEFIRDHCRLNQQIEGCGDA